MYWAQDNRHVAGDAHHRTHPRIATWCAIHGNTLLGPEFLEERMKAERYLQLLNGAWEPHVDEMPLVVRRYDFLQEGAPPNTAGELRNWRRKLFQEDGFGTGDRSNDHQIRRTPRPYIFSSGVICRHLCTISVYVPLTQLTKTPAVLLQTTHLRF